MLEIQEQFISYNRSSRSTSPIYIVIHSTGNTSDTAQNNHDYFAGADRQASADFFIDDTNIIQIIDTDNFYSWAVGDGAGAYGITNKNSVSIEMCGTDSGNISDTTIANTLDLVNYLMDKYSIGIDNVVRHYDASHKSCPYQFMTNSWARWFDFKDQLSSGTSTSTSSTVSGAWVLQDSKWWYKHTDGTYTKDGWEKIDSKWYLFDTEGYMIFDWKNSGGNWYYLSTKDDGSMQTGWIFDSTLRKWYYLNASGVMQTGWVKVDAKWYYLDSTGAMTTGWISDGGNDYCCYSDGSMIVNTTAYGYTFASNGVASKTV